MGVGGGGVGGCLKLLKLSRKIKKKKTGISGEVMEIKPKYPPMVGLWIFSETTMKLIKLGR